jgi:hypothetical protein
LYLIGETWGLLKLLLALAARRPVSAALVTRGNL